MKKIAVVNDERDFVEMVSLLLTEEGYSLRAAMDGEQGLALIREWQPDLVLLDIRMRGLSGWQIIERLNAEQLASPPRILVTSGAVEEVGAARARLQAMGHDSIALPFDIDEFITKVKKMVGDAS